MDKDQIKEMLGLRAKEIIKSGIRPSKEKGQHITCPFHNDSHPSMSWFENGLMWRCNVCNETLDIYRYLQEWENMNFKQAVNQVAEWVGVEGYKDIKPKKTYVKPKDDFDGLSDQVIAHAKARGIKKQTLEAWNVKSAKDVWYIFQYFDDRSRHVFNSMRKTTEKKCMREKDTKSILYGMNHIDVNEPVLIVEGQFDALAVWQSGYKNVVSVPSGISDTNWIENCYSFVQRVKRFVIWADGDKAGVDGANAIRSRLGNERVSVIISEYKDANDMLQATSEAEVLDFIQDAMREKVEGAINMGRRTNANAISESYYTGFYDLDRHFKKLQSSTLSIVFGRDNEGKSTFVSQMIAHMLKSDKVFLYSGELSDAKVEEWIMRQLIGRRKGMIDVSLDEWGDKEFTIKQNVKTAIRKWYKDKFYLYEEKMDTNNIFEVMESAYKKYGVKIFILDNLMSAVDVSDTNENAQQTSFIKKCKQFNLKYNVPVVILAHPNKEGSREHEPLFKHHVSGSKNITNAADNIISIERVWDFVADLSEDYMMENEHGERYTTIVRCLKDRVAAGRKVIHYNFDVPSNRFYNANTPLWENYGWEKFLAKEVKFIGGGTQTFEKGEMG